MSADRKKRKKLKEKGKRWQAPRQKRWCNRGGIPGKGLDHCKKFSFLLRIQKGSAFGLSCREK